MARSLLLSLSSNIILHIITFLSRQERIQIRLVCKSLQSIMDDSRLALIIPITSFHFVPEKDCFFGSISSGRILEIVDYLAKRHFKKTGIDFLGIKIEKETFKSLPNSLYYLRFDICTNPSSVFKHIPSGLVQLDISNFMETIPVVALEKLTKLEQLTLTGSRVTDKTLPIFPKSLTSLNLSYCKITDESLKSLPTKLQILNISNTEVTGECFKHLPSSIKELNLAYCRVSDEKIRSLSTLSNLNNLNLSFSQELSESGLKTIPSTVKKLTILCCAKLTEKSLKAVPSSVKEVVNNINPIEYLQACVRRFLSKKKLANDKSITKQKRRVAILREILNSERVYTRQLTSLVEEFQKPLLASSLSSNPIIFIEKANRIFSNIEDIQRFHQGFLVTLELFFKEWPCSNNQISSIFMNSFNATIQAVYTKYIKNFDKASKALNSMNKQQNFVKFAEKCFEKVKQKDATFLHLPSYLILPIQRIPRYYLLFDDLAKNTDQSNKELNDIITCTTFLKNTANLINDSIEEDSKGSESPRNSFTGESSRPSYMNPTASSARKIQNPLEIEKPKESVWKPSGRAKSKEIFSSAFIYINVPYDEESKKPKDKKISSKMSSSFAAPSKASIVAKQVNKQKSLGIDDLRREMKKK